MATNNTGTLDRSTGYLVGRIKGQLDYVHRRVIGARKGEIVDHINGDKLDNRLENLRIVSKSQNNRNRKAKGYTMVNSGRFQVKTTYRNRTYYIGTYDTEAEAQLAYQAVSKFAFDITGIDVEAKNTETIQIGGKTYEVSDELKDALKGLKEL